MSSTQKTRVIFVGVGGATCSGKTTLAKHLQSILPDSVIIHQDDFAPPQELVPYHPVYNVQDWDAPAGAIDWRRMIDFLRHVKSTGVIPEEHYSHDHLNEQKEVRVASEVKEKWRKEFERIKERKLQVGERVVWGLVDGFLLYWHPEVIEQLDVRIFLRVPHDTLKERRHQRHGYHTAAATHLLPTFLFALSRSLRTSLIPFFYCNTGCPSRSAIRSRGFSMARPAPLLGANRVASICRCSPRNVHRGRHRTRRADRQSSRCFGDRVVREEHGRCCGCVL